jgi:hypothetical protein
MITMEGVYKRSDSEEHDGQGAPHRHHELRHKYFKNKKLRRIFVAKNGFFWQKYPLFVAKCYGVSA